MVRKEVTGLLLVIVFLILSLCELIRNMNKYSKEFEVTDIMVEIDNVKLITPLREGDEITYDIIELGNRRGYVLNGHDEHLYVVIPLEQE